jgi:hypothetical protein
MNRTIFLVCALLPLSILPHSAAAQRIFEDARGESSLFLQNKGGFARINFGNGTARLAYLNAVTTNRFFYGAELTGKLSGDAATLFQSNQATPNTSARLTFGWLLRNGSKSDADIPTTDWIVLQLGYSRARYTLFDPSVPIAGQITKRNFDGLSARLNYNLAIGGGQLWGISIGAERRNNSDDLDEIEINDQIFSGNNGMGQRTAFATQKALVGDYATHTAIPFYMDYVIRLAPRIRLNTFLRWDLSRSEKTFEPGIGIFFTEENQPTKVIGGLSVSIRDGKGKFGLVAGFNF